MPSSNGQIRLLIVAPHRLGRNPGQRFRFEQYLGFLKANGFEITVSPLLDRWDDRQFYASGPLALAVKALVLAKAAARRITDVLRAGGFDIIFIYREAWMLGSIAFERGLKLSGAKIVLDFDDAIWLPTVSEGNRGLAFLKNPRKTDALTRLADLVLVGNDYLAAYARQFNHKVAVIPTTLDTENYTPGPPKVYAPGAPVRIGWSGSPTTVPHFRLVEPALKVLKKKYGPRVEFVLCGDGQYTNAELGIQGQAWALATELPTVRSFDVGLMPLPDDEWSRGKCGFKALFYMSLGVPAVASPVGVNPSIIEDGVNGCLATSTEDWVNVLTRLIENPSLRSRLGQAGRETVVAQYSVAANRGKYLSALQGLVTKP